ncbi:MAG: glycosyltransferase family 4 protein [Confluentibacter sp.]|nr:glycosyltransferase family 4 protein [Confluentibacter sp.]
MDIIVTQDFFPKIGGAHLWLYETYRRWPSPVKLLTHRYGCETREADSQTIFDARKHGSLRIFRENIAIDNISLFNSQCRNHFWQVSSIIRRLMDRNSNTIHCLRAFPEGFLGLLCKLKNPFQTCLIVYAHGEEILVAKSSRQLWVIANLVYRIANLVIVNSKNTELLVKSLCPQAITVCIHPGVDTTLFLRKKQELEAYRQQWQWPKNTIVVSTVARMEPRKNQATVLRAIADLRREGLPLAYVCGGGGEERAKLYETTQSLGLDAWVRFTGVLTEDEKIMIYGASDIYAMPSIEYGQMIEGFGIVFLEAAAAGIPSICGSVGGQPEAVLDQKTGIVVNGLDVVAVKNAIRRLAIDSNLRDKMGQEGILWAQEHDWSRVSAAIYDAILNHTMK